MRISLATGSTDEIRTEHQLRDILQSNPAIYDSVFTRDVRIDALSVPHSHPGHWR